MSMIRSSVILDVGNSSTKIYLSLLVILGLMYRRTFKIFLVHTHAGVFSYTGWINLPPESLFEFLYPSTIGLSLTQRIELTPEDEGGIIIFPSMLQHCVHPFSDNSKRISVSGNIVLEVS